MEIYEYRECEFEKETFANVVKKKKKLGKILDENSKIQGNHYIKISNKNGKYYNSFSEIYKNKCAYCGVNTAINSTNLFEIDHYVNKAQKKSGIDNIENLIFACRKCNQSKKAFEISADTDEYNLFHPDGNKLSNIFKRDNKYNIFIDGMYVNNGMVESFYNKLKLSDYSRRLDYLLLRMYHLKKCNKLSNGLMRVYNDLLEMRNRMGY